MDMKPGTGEFSRLSKLGRANFWQSLGTRLLENVILVGVCNLANSLLVWVGQKVRFGFSPEEVMHMS